MEVAFEVVVVAVRRETREGGLRGDYPTASGRSSHLGRNRATFSLPNRRLGRDHQVDLGPRRRPAREPKERPRRPGGDLVQRRVELHRLHDGVRGEVRQGPGPHARRAGVQRHCLPRGPHPPAPPGGEAGGDPVAARHGARPGRAGRHARDTGHRDGARGQVGHHRAGREVLPPRDGGAARRVLHGETRRPNRRRGLRVGGIGKTMLERLARVVCCVVGVRQFEWVELISGAAGSCAQVPAQWDASSIASDDIFKTNANYVDEFNRSTAYVPTYNAASGSATVMTL